MLRPIALLAALFCIGACARDADGDGDGTTTAAASASSPAALRIQADVEYLADDKLEGRATGTPGFELAAEYIAQRYTQVGLQPAGDDGGFFQRVPLLKAVREDRDAAFVVERGGTRTALKYGTQYLPALNYNTARHSLRAPAVFVGHGVHAPELGYDDFSGVDVRGRIAVLFSGAPSRFDNDQRAFYSSITQKLRTLVEQGAIGAVLLNTREQEQRTPWQRVAMTAKMPGMRLRGENGKGIDTFPELQAVAAASAASAEVLLAGTTHTADALFKAAEDGTLKPFELPGTLLLAGGTRIERVESRNVVARLPGSDAALAAEHVVYTAHLDHVGIGPAVDGDIIYNGALDNALGVSVMLEAARELSTAAARPKRSMLFVALTAEEKGLLGAEWFAAHPGVPRESLVANINVDMPVLLAPSRDVVPIGVEHSTLKRSLDAAAAEVGVSLSPDPAPAEVVFVRSDQFAFVRAGVPAVYLKGGVHAAAGASESPAKAEQAFRRNCYHQPCDDTSQPIQYADAARLAQLNARIGQRVGDETARPEWNEGDFFGERFGAKQ